MVVAAYPTDEPLMTRAEYDELAERGVLEYARVELLYGRIVSMRPIGNPHAYSVTKLAEILTEYWIVNLRNEVIEVYRDPSAVGYEATTRHSRGDVLQLEQFPDVSLRVSDILPPQR